MNNQVRIDVGDVLVVGEINHRSSRDIVVTILKPYRNISYSKHMPCFAYPSNDYSGEYGIAVAKQLLNQIYALCKVTEEVAHKMKDVIKDLDVLKNEYQEKTNLNRRLKRILLRNFKIGIITQTQYQNSLTAMDREVTYSHTKIMEFFDDNIQPYFSSTIPFSSRNAVIDYIKSINSDSLSAE